MSLFHTPRAARTRAQTKKEQLANELKTMNVTELEDTVLDPRRIKSDICVAAVSGPAQLKAGSKKTNSRSSSTLARQRILEYETAQASAQIDLQLAETKARLEKDLLEKRLAAEIADLHDGSSHISQSKRSSVSFNSKVQEWLEKSIAAPGSSLNHNDNHLVRVGGGDSHRNIDDGNRDAMPRNQELIQTRTNSNNPPRTDILILADVLRDAVGISTSKLQNQELLTRLATNKDLPLYFGDPMEWLQFKEAYNESTRLCKFTESENLLRLRKCLRGDAREAASSLFISNTSPKEVMGTLELRFGRPENIIRKISTQLKKLQPLPQSYHNDIVNFAIKIKNNVAAVRAIQEDDYLRSPELVSVVLSKLPTILISKWAEFLFTKRDGTTPKLELLSTFLYEEAVKIAHTGASHIFTNNQSEYKKRNFEYHKNNVNNNQAILLTATNHQNIVNKCKYCRKSAHEIAECSQFKRSMRKDRWRFARSNRLCFKCLKERHVDPSECPADNCDVNGCGWPHHRLLHWTKPGSPQTSPAVDEQQVSETITHTMVQCPNVMLKIVPVTVHGPSGAVHAHALLDDGATITLIASDLANEVGLHGESVTMRARSAWTADELVCKSEIVKFELSNNSEQRYKLCARKINELNLPVRFTSNMDFSKYEKLYNYKFCKCSVQPKLLIGQDNYDLIAPIVCVKNRSDGSYVTQTSLGWCVHGSLCPVSCARPRSFTPLVPDRSGKDFEDCIATAQVSAYAHPLSHSCASDLINLFTTADAAVTPLPSPPLDAPEPYVYHTHNNNNICDTDLDNFIRKSFSLDCIGITSKPRQNEDELKAISILNNTSELIQGQWTVGLPWKQDPSEISMPNSYHNASNRLKSIKKKMSFNNEYATRYKERVEHLFINNYARELTDLETSDRVWYLPHFGVDNPNKNKLRLVFDAAAKTNGYCLNDFLLQGPDLLQSLYGILFRFRENPVGVVGDIKDMFLRIKIREVDQHALRFLWIDKDNLLKEYVMTSLIFGANCSPFIAQFINQNKNASRFLDRMPTAVQAIQTNQYMDDYIDSLPDVNTCTQIIKDISYINMEGGFEMRGWISNEPSVLNDIPKASLSNNAIRLNTDNEPERALGLLWFPSSDTLALDLSFKRIPSDILNLNKKPTKREMLRIVMSILDVHGIISPFMIKAKILMRNTWKINLKWDDEITDDLYISFREWILQMQEIKNIRIPRWYFRAGEVYTGASETELQLHIFCDGSPSAYSAVVYWRREDSNGCITVSFVASKCRVAPLKPVSVPRLELQGAVLGCRLAASVVKEHRLKPNATFYWTDSTTVLHWIRNQNRNYKTFIANRLGEIDEYSNVTDWHYVPTGANIADIATKVTNYELKSDSEWFTGPTFLYGRRNTWPTEPVNNKKISEDTLEQINTVFENNKQFDLPVPEPKRFSSWLRLLRATATVLLFIEKCKKRKIYEINNELMSKAKILLIRHAQSESFQCEINALKQNIEIKRDSRLRSLTPVIDENGLLRVGGRIDAAKDVDRQTKYPVILDGKNHISRLIVLDYHIRAAHSCNEMVINELRQTYWIVQLRPTVRAVSSRCLVCRIRKAMPRPPRLGDLPESRLTHHQRPFSVCGVDLFGPVQVSLGRHRSRRYGVLFTCMTVRAVHIEIVPSLTADSMIMALRRMAARRGWPHTILSDNGTNLRGAEKELKKSFEEVDQNSVVSQALNCSVNWKFIPPVSPHMAGAWERLVRSVKTALRVILKERAPKEEVFLTLLAEVENMINSRPLTHVSVDPRSQETLTPNHFLLGSSSNLPVPGHFDDGDLYLRKQWRITQRLADLFWGRWMKEVLPTLVPRCKWQREGEQLKTGDLVVVVDPSSPRNTWPKGIVQQVYPGADGRVRVLDIKTKSGTMKRPATRVALLFRTECRHDDTGGEDVDDATKRTI